VPVDLALAVAKVESGGDCEARSPKGALGVMQVLPETAREVGVHPSQLLTCEGPALAGVRYLQAALQKAGGDRAHALSLYNRGLYSGARHSPYANRVLSN
jgi:soluble lytic murein transglycosylase-like protein